MSNKKTIQILRKQLDKNNKQLEAKSKQLDRKSKQLEAERALWKSNSTAKRLNKTIEIFYVAQTRGT